MIHRAVFRSPEERAKKGDAAQVDAANVAELIISAGIVFSVYFHVLAHQQTWQCHWHKRTVQNSVLEADARIFWKKTGARPAIKPTEKHGGGQKNGDF